MSSWRRRRPFTPVGALEVGGSFRLLRLKKCLGQQKFSLKKCFQKGQQKVSSVFPKKVNKNRPQERYLA